MGWRRQILLVPRFLSNEVSSTLPSFIFLLTLSHTRFSLSLSLSVLSLDATATWSAFFSTDVNLIPWIEACLITPAAAERPRLSPCLETVSRRRRRLSCSSSNSRHRHRCHFNPRHNPRPQIPLCLRMAEAYQYFRPMATRQAPSLVAGSTTWLSGSLRTATASSPQSPSAARFCGSKKLQLLNWKAKVSNWLLHLVHEKFSYSWGTTRTDHSYPPSCHAIFA